MSASALDKLGKSIQAAAAEIKKLRRENDRLKETAAKLEQSPAAVPEADPEAAAWADERVQIKGRLEELSATLEAALAEERALWSGALEAARRSRREPGRVLSSDGYRSAASVSRSREDDRQMASDKTAATEVEIFGSVYHVRGEKQPEYLHSLAEMVDRKMREIGQHVSTVNTSKIAILAALNLADELVQCRTQQEGERADFDGKVAELAGKLDQVVQQS